MSDQEILKRFERILSEYNSTMGITIRSSGVKPTDHFCQDLGGDSLDLISMIIALEEEFRIEIEEGDFVESNPWVIGNLIRYIQQKRQKGERSAQ